MLRRDDLEHDPEELEGVDRADDQVVVRVLSVVEVEAAEKPFLEQEGDDLLDVRSQRVMSGIDEHLRLRAESAADEDGGAPVGQVGAVEGRLEELVLDEEAHSGRQGGIQLSESFEQAAVALPHVVLAGIVRAVCQPDGEDVGAHLRGDVDALEAVIDRHPAHACFRMAEAAEPVVVALEDVAVDRAKPHAFARGERRKRTPVIDPVPGRRGSATVGQAPVRR